MMTTTPRIALTLFKAHLNLDHTLDDALLAHKLAAAEEWCRNFVGPDNLVASAVIDEAIMQLAAHWYEQREAVAFGGSGQQIPFGVLEILAPFKEQVTGHVAH